MGKALLKLQFALVVLGLAAALPRIADNAPSDLEQAGTEDREGRQWGSNTWGNNWGSNNNNWGSNNNNWGSNNNNWGANSWGSNNNNWGSNNNNNKPSQQTSGGDGFLGDWLSQHNEVRLSSALCYRASFFILLFFSFQQLSSIGYRKSKQTMCRSNLSPSDSAEASEHA